MFKKIDHVEIIPGDVDKTLSFYTDILGFKVQSRRKMDTPVVSEIIFIELGGTVIEFLVPKNPTPKTEEPWQIGYLRIALEVDDMDEAVKYLREKGVTISREPVAIGDSKRGEILDPNGLSIELRQW